jgi:hypothetical protein
MLARNLADPALARAGHGDGLTREQRESRFRARIVPAGERLRPGRGWIGRKKRFGEDDQRGAVARRLGGEHGEFLDRGVAIEHDRLGLDTGDHERAVHCSIEESLPAPEHRNARRGPPGAYLKALKYFIGSSMRSNL